MKKQKKIIKRIDRISNALKEDLRTFLATLTLVQTNKMNNENLSSMIRVLVQRQMKTVWRITTFFETFRVML